MNYLLRCQHGDHKYWATVCNVSLSCTRSEVVHELARKANVPALHVVAVDNVLNNTMGMVLGQEWSKS